MMMPVRCAGKAACRSGSGLNEGLGVTEVGDGADIPGTRAQSFEPANLGL